MDIKALQRGAGLTAVDEGAPEQTFGDLLGVGVGQDDAGVIAAKLERQALQRSAALWP